MFLMSQLIVQTSEIIFDKKNANYYIIKHLNMLLVEEMK